VDADGRAAILTGVPDSTAGRSVGRRHRVLLIDDPLSGIDLGRSPVNRYL
jgi:hypothetical protein